MNKADALDKFINNNSEIFYGIHDVLAIRVERHMFLHKFKQFNLSCLQTFRPAADELSLFGFNVVTHTSEMVDMCIFMATKHRDEDLYHLALGASLLRDNGIYICSSANDEGACSLEKKFIDLFGHADSYSKSKCRVIFARKGDGFDHELCASWLEKGRLQPIHNTDLLGQPGIFSWNHVDVGSALLARFLPENLAGIGADLGAGYGYLSYTILKKCEQIEELHLFEAELRALDAAKSNLSGLNRSTQLFYHWSDVTLGLPLEKFDWIIMNPPFHIGKNVKIDLGLKFIKCAADSLRHNGVLYLVANIHLPYEKELRSLFKRNITLAEESGYKVIVSYKGL